MDERMNFKGMYVCKDSGITAPELMDFADYNTPRIAYEDKERLEIRLKKYGNSFDEISNFLFNHFMDCDGCSNEYQKHIGFLEFGLDDEGFLEYNSDDENVERIISELKSAGLFKGDNYEY